MFFPNSQVSRSLRAFFNSLWLFTQNSLRYQDSSTGNALECAHSQSLDGTVLETCQNKIERPRIKYGPSLDNDHFQQGGQNLRISLDYPIDYLPIKQGTQHRKRVPSRTHPAMGRRKTLSCASVLDSILSLRGAEFTTNTLRELPCSFLSWLHKVVLHHCLNSSSDDATSCRPRLPVGASCLDILRITASTAKIACPA